MKKFIILSIVALLSACGYEIENPTNWELGDFSFRNQDGDDFGLEELNGKVWVANFIFTNCETVCSPMTAHMAKLQGMIEDEGLKAEIVSFSVDPEVDKPKVLKGFASKFDADLTNWHFLTGYSQAEIEAYALENFKTLVQKPKGNDQVNHGTSFYVVDKSGVVKQSYSGVSDTPYDQMIKDIKSLQ
ncbi:SCO family protein [Cytobacillus sp. S13-E01]|uniref:SCO family protein n=1 Tax=Cytobacillus sp. S13-E01 TaxID=3031326 RepID=UPI0023D7FBA1|nr:SCO family protein [Cytobacillus sp. S13-E01]MDF0725721.1 SCO family protein [Cytobacillus sp. S13-E01]